MMGSMDPPKACTTQSILASPVQIYTLNSHLAIRFILLIVIEQTFLALTTSAQQQQQGVLGYCPTVMFTFGDSLSDTGNSQTALSPPYGETFFKHPADRFSDGRIAIDFMAQAFGLPFLDPYMRFNTSDFSHGVNFASSGATARSVPLVSPFYLEVQVNQLIEFQQKVIASQASNGSKPSLPPIESFSTGLYFLFIGFNDIFQNLMYNKFTLSTLKANIIPEAIQSIATAIQTLHNSVGARNFLVLDVPGMGCIPKLISTFGNADESQYDSFGCINDFNDLAQTHNQLLHDAIKNLSSQFPDAMILTFDSYGLYMNAMANPVGYELDQSKLLEACCGGGGKFNVTVQDCNSNTMNLCDNPQNYINWDGVHFTETFNRMIANASLTGSYLDPPHNFNLDCSLDLGNFI